MTRTAVYEAFVVNAYRRVQSEEGAYDAHCGYNVCASSEDRDGYLHRFIYVSNTGLDGAYVFADLEAARRLVDRINAAGDIDAERYWDCYGCQHKDALPDYVENWWRPEYN